MTASSVQWGSVLIIDRGENRVRGTSANKVQSVRQCETQRIGLIHYITVVCSAGLPL